MSNQNIEIMKARKFPSFNFLIPGTLIKGLLIISILIPLNMSAQTKFTSSKYNYSFIIPDGWHIKDTIYNPEVDAKIVDGKGNSFIVLIKDFPNPTNLSIKQQMEGTSNKELKEQFEAVYGETQIVKRGTVIIGLKEFYYIHLLTPFTDGIMLYHKQFAYSEGNRVLSIDACSIEPYINETTPAFSLMITTFEFADLDDKHKNVIDPDKIKKRRFIKL